MSRTRSTSSSNPVTAREIQKRREEKFAFGEQLAAALIDQLVQKHRLRRKRRVGVLCTAVTRGIQNPERGREIAGTNVRFGDDELCFFICRERVSLPSGTWSGRSVECRLR